VGSDRPRKYWNDLKKKLAAEGYFELSEKIGQLKMSAPDGNCVFQPLAFPARHSLGDGGSFVPVIGKFGGADQLPSPI
jgi:hypothetical protein